MAFKRINKKEIGFLGESFAASYLQGEGYIIVERNFQTRFGEIDLVAKKGNTLVFFEVKTRLSKFKGKPYEAVSLRKLRVLKRLIYFFLLKNQFKNYKLRVDVIGIVLDRNFKLLTLKHYQNIDLARIRE